MKCLEFKRLALTDPNSEDVSFIRHSAECVECLKYVGSVRQMDSDLKASVDVEVPKKLFDRLQGISANEGDEVRIDRPMNWRYLPKVAALAVVFLFAGLLLNNLFESEQQVGGDYQSLLAGINQHLHTVTETPVWEASVAHSAMSSILLDHDSSGMRFAEIPTLTFARFCPMGEYRGIHATLQLQGKKVTFAYIKSKPVERTISTSYGDQAVKIQPLKEGNLVVISNDKSMTDEAMQQLDSAIYWEI